MMLTMVWFSDAWRLARFAACAIESAADWNVRSQDFAVIIVIIVIIGCCSYSHHTVQRIYQPI